jgi:copper(I)-binding protein
VLIGGSTPQADKVEFHQSTMDNGIMKMRPATNGVSIPAVEPSEFKPDGYHVMLIGLKDALRSGTMLPVTLDSPRQGRLKSYCR